MDLTSAALDLQPLPQDEALQNRLNVAALSAIDKAFDGFSLADRIEAHLAKEADETGIRQLFDRYPMGLAGFNLIYDRSPDFFSLLKARGNASIAFTGGYKKDSSLLGLGSLSIRNGYYQGHQARVAYLGDLRIVPNRDTFRLWRSMYGNLLNETARALEVESFLTAILGDNAIALRSLVSRRGSDFAYEPLGTLRMINLFGTFAPMKATGDISLQASRVTESAFDEFYHAHQPTIRHGWRGESGSGVPVLVHSRDGRPVLGARLVSPDSMKRMRVENVGTKMKMLFQMLRLAGVKAPRAGDWLTTVYFARLTFSPELSPVERRRAMIELIDSVYRDEELKMLSNGRTMLAVPDTVGLSVRDLRGRFHQATPVELFEVRPQASRISVGRIEHGLGLPTHSIGFEMALV